MPRSASGAIPAQVLQSKFSPPRHRAGLVERPRLVERLNQGLGARLTLVDAPAGYGKSTLLGQWVRARPDLNFGWVSLEASDNEEGAFWWTFWEGLRRVAPQLRRPTRRSQPAGRDFVRNVLMTQLLNQLEGLTEPLVLVLDDYHLITDRECQESLAFFIDQTPRELHLVIATRVDPALPLPRFRAYGTMNELRMAALRFEQAEAGEMFARSLSFELSQADVDSLVEKTEGWPAGLYLASLSLGRTRDPASFVRAFAGTHRHIVDYLGSEVLASREPGLREFLRRTSILERFSAELCDEVLGRDDSAATLAEIERSNLFVVPLDAEGRWFRYHPLFRQLLQAELQASEPLRVSSWHRRAARTLRAQSLPLEALHHALLSEDEDVTTDTVLEAWPELASGGHMRALLRWVHTLTPAQVSRRPETAALAAMLQSLGGGRVHSWTLAAAPAVPDLRVFGGVQSMDGFLLAARALSWVPDVEEALQDSERLLSLEPTAGTAGHALALLARGQALYLAGQNGQARENLEAVRSQPAPGLLGQVALLRSLCLLVHLDSSDGRHEEAEQSLLEAEALAAARWPNDTDFPREWRRLRSASSRVLASAGRLAEARVTLQLAVDGVRGGTDDLLFARDLLMLSQLQGLTGEEALALDSYQRASAILAQTRHPGFLLTLKEEARTQLASLSVSSQLTERLSAREHEILKLLAEGRSQAEIAQSLVISQNTVKTHTRALYRKFNAASREEALTRARRYGLL